MIGLMYLAVIWIFVICVMAISRRLSSKTMRVIFVIASVGLPIGYLNWYPLYPSYSKFLELCGSPNRTIVHQTKKSDILYLEGLRGRGIEAFFQGSDGYEAIAVRHRSNEFIFYSKNKNNEIEHEFRKIEFMPYNIVSENSWLIDGTLRQWNAKYIDHELGIVAEANDYTYYPYGNSWAIYLGGSSGSAPSKECAVRSSNIDMSKVYTAK